MAAQPGYDLFVSGRGGLMSVTGEPGGTPQRAGINFVDYMAGLNAAIGILLALQARVHTGKGQQVAVSLLDSLLSTAGHIVTGYTATGLLPVRTAGNQHQNIVPYGTFQTSDGHINVGVIAAKSWVPFCRALGRPDLAADQSFASNAGRVAARDQLLATTQKEFLQRSSDEWLAAFTAYDVPCGPIQSYDQVLTDPQVTTNEALMTVDHPRSGPVTLVRTPVRLSATPAVDASPAPLRGQHQSDLEEVSPWHRKP